MLLLHLSGILPVNYYFNSKMLSCCDMMKIYMCYLEVGGKNVLIVGAEHVRLQDEVKCSDV